MKYFKLKFLLLFFALAAALPPAWAEEVTLDFTNNNWGIPEGSTNSEWHSNSYSNGTYSITLEAQSSGGYYIQTYQGPYLILGKSGAKLTFQEFNKPVKKIEVIGRTGASQSVTQNIFVGTTAICTETKGAEGTNTYEIPEEYQEVGTIYYLKVTSKHNTQITKINITLEDGGDTPITEKVATPTFSLAGGSYDVAQDVEITCATDDATIYYTTDGTTPDENSAVYTDAITVNKTMTIKAIAMKAGMDNSDVATATYTLPVIVSNLAEIKDLSTGTEFVYNGYAVVTYAYDSQQYDNADVWIRDDQGNAIYLFRAKPLGFKNGDVLKTGWTATKDVYNGLTELKNVTMEKDGTDEASPIVVPELTSNYISQYVRLENISAIDGAQWYDKFSTGLTLNSNKQYNVEGIVGYNNQLQFYPIRVEEIAAPEPELTITLDPAEKSTTVGETIAVTVTANTEAEVIYEYEVSPTTAMVAETATGFTITSATAGEVTVTVNALDDNNREATATGTYTFEEPAAPLASEFVLVTDINKLAPGKQIIFVNTNTADQYADAMSKQQRSKNRGVTTVVVTDNNTITATDDTEIFTLEKEGDYWYFKANKTSGYIYAAGGTSENLLKTSDSKTNTAQATISIDEKAIVTFNVTGTGARNLLSYNLASDPSVYSCYRAEQNPIYIYVEKGDTPEPVEAELSYAQTAFTVYADADFTEPTLANPHNLTVTYSSNNEEVAMVDETTGEVVLMGKAGEATIMATSAATDEYLAGSASYTITVEARPVLAADEKVEFETTVGTSVEKTFTVMGENLKGDITLTLADETGMFKINPTTIDKANAAEATVTVTYAPTAEDIHEATVTLRSQDADSVTVSLIGMATEPEQVATPTFSLVAGSYTGQQPLTISCETADAVISYSTDGGNNWTEGNTLTLTEDVTVMAKATKAGSLDSEVAVAAYIIDIPAELPSIEPLKGYYSIKNNGNGKYANVAGRKTLNFTTETAQKAGTVIYVETNNKGQVQSLRSQGADLQGYANKAMNYVPELVHLVAQKLETEGVGELFGETGVDAILAKFNESFDHHLYVETAGEGYRLYGKTPSMQPVVEFYRENQAKVEAKLPMLETAINNAIQKILEKTNGSGASILTPFSLHQIWENMGGNLTEPTNDASTMDFYRQVLNNKNNVWSFAYETAMIYWTNLKNHPKYESMIKPQLGEYAEYLDKLEQVRPDFKYYVAQKDDKPDFISQGNTDIINNNGRAIWTLEPRAEFQVNIPAENKYGAKSYATTLYTDFAYTTPEGVVAYKVTDVDELGYAKIAKIDGIIPAQTPVMIMDTTGVAGVKTLTITTKAGAPVNGNLLVGPDYLIGEYQIKAPTVEKLFNLVKNLFGEEIYNRYMLQYEHLMLRYAGTVNNKYFWGLSEEDVAMCGTTNEYDQTECVVRNLGKNDKGEMVFLNDGIVATNKAFLVNDKFTEIKLSVRGDVNRNGEIEIGDVSALIDILLTLPERPYDPQFDYIAADFDENGEIAIKDVSALIDYLLHVTY